MSWGLITTLFLSLAHTAMADEAHPEVKVDSTGVVEGQILLPAPKSEVRHLLSDAVAASKLSSDVYDASTTSEGRCEIVYRKVRGIWTPITYRARRCPTNNGWVENLVDSDTVSDYYMEWTLEGTEDGTRVGYKIKTAVKFPLPASMVQGETKRSVKRMLQNLFAKFARKKNKK